MFRKLLFLVCSCLGLALCFVAACRVLSVESSVTSSEGNTVGFWADIPVWISFLRAYAQENFLQMVVNDDPHDESCDLFVACEWYGVCRYRLGLDPVTCSECRKLLALIYGKLFPWELTKPTADLELEHDSVSKCTFTSNIQLSEHQQWVLVLKKKNQLGAFLRPHCVSLITKSAGFQIFHMQWWWTPLCMHITACMHTQAVQEAKISLFT